MSILDISHLEKLQKRFVKIFENDVMNNNYNQNNLTDFCNNLFLFFKNSVDKYGYNNCFVFSPNTICKLQTICYGYISNKSMDTKIETNKFIIDNIRLNISLINDDIEDCNWNIKIHFIDDSVNESQYIQYLIFAVRKNMYCYPINFYYKKITPNKITQAKKLIDNNYNTYFKLAPIFCIEFSSFPFKRSDDEEDLKG